jgi:hypothetical protein
MNWIGWAAVLLVVLTALFFTIRAVVRIWVAARRAFSQYRTVSPDTLAAHLGRLLRRGSNGAALIITDPATDRFVQLRKYVHSKDQYGLSFDFPRAPWSEPYYQELQGRLDTNHMGFVLQPTLNDPVKEFLQVDCGRDVDFADKLVRMVLFEIFKLPAERRLRVSDEDTVSNERLADHG